MTETARTLLAAPSPIYRLTEEERTGLHNPTKPTPNNLHLVSVQSRTYRIRLLPAISLDPA
jgi:hypothetical protein